MKNKKHSSVSALTLKKSLPVFHYSNNLIWLLIIPVLVFIVYRSVMNFSDVAWDDKHYLRETPMVQGLTWGNVKLMFTNKVLRSYNPLVLVSFALDYKMAKLKPQWCHDVNLFFHILNALLVYACMKKLRFRSEVSGIIALLFALHPLSVEAVAWIAGRKDVLYGFFYLLAWLSYLYFYKSGKKYQYALALLFFICSLFSKVQAITFPFILIISDYMLSGKRSRKILINKIPFLILSFIFGFIAISEGNLVADKYSMAPAEIDKLTYSIMGFGLYFQKLLFPFNQSSIYSFPVAGSMEFYRMLIIGIIIVLFFAFAIYYTVNKAPLVAGGLLFYCISISVILHVVAFNSALIYERFTYLASIGLFISIVNLDQLFPRWKNYSVKILPVVVLFFAVLTYNRVFIWRNAETMWSDVIEKNPKAFEAYNNRGMVYLDKKDYDHALIDFNECIRLNPKHPDAYNNRSVVYFNQKKYNDALIDNAEVLKINPEHFDGLTNRGCFFFTLDNYDSSAYYYSVASKLMPHNASPFYFCGLSYYKKGLYDKARENYLEAIRISPGYSDVYALLAVDYVQLGNNDSALYYVNAAESISPSSTAREMVSKEYLTRGTAAYQKGDSRSALELYEQASKIMPTNAEAFYDIGGIYLSQQNLPKAREYWKKTLEIDPHHKAAREWLQKIGG